MASELEQLRAAASLHDIAALLHYKPSRLSFIIYILGGTEKYTEFEIPKQSGGVRKIKAPIESLKLLQRRVADLFVTCLAELKKTEAPRPPLSHGYVRGQSIITNATVHKRRRYVLNLDIKDFFGAIHFGRLRGVLIKDRRFELHEKVATIIAQIACFENSLPQGSPCSPIFSNIVANFFDIRLARLARVHKCSYSRYVDDITFSTNLLKFPAEIAEPADMLSGEWQLGKALLSEFRRADFQVNDAKTRMQLRSSRQITTGLIVNQKVNIRPEYYRTIRAMCSELFNSGGYYQVIPPTLHGGSAGAPTLKTTTTNLATLNGRLAHVYYVRNLVDMRNPVEKKKHATVTRRLYHRFLFYRNFVALDRPLIIPEGKTDTIYLRAAIERLSIFHPKLGTVEAGKLKSNLQFLNYTQTVHDVLQLGGGTGDIKHFMIGFVKRLSSFRHRPLAHPIILLIDNDDGAKEIFSVAKEMMQKSITHASTEPFYRLHANLYLIKTPETAGSNPHSDIESLFEVNLLNEKIAGLRFDPSKQGQDGNTYGKVWFAEKIVRPQKGTINFDGFVPLLNRITAVIDDYSANPNFGSYNKPENVLSVF
jgi:RNA-directed DNA polymerase